MTAFTHTNISHVTVPVGTSSTPVIASNPSRTYGLFVNDSDEVIYLSQGNSASAGAGIPLDPKGGHFEMSPSNWNLDTGEFSAVHSGAGEKNLLVTVGNL